MTHTFDKLYNGTFGSSQDHFCVRLRAFHQLLKGLKISTAMYENMWSSGAMKPALIRRNSLLFRLILLRTGSVLGSFWILTPFAIWLVPCGSQHVSKQVPTKFSLRFLCIINLFPNSITVYPFTFCSKSSTFVTLRIPRS